MLVLGFGLSVLSTILTMGIKSHSPPIVRSVRAAQYHDNVPDCDDPDAGFEHVPEAFKLLELFVQGVDGGYLVVDPDLASKEFLDEIVAKAKAVLAAERSKT